MAFVVRELSEVPENTGQKVVASVRFVYILIFLSSWST